MEIKRMIFESPNDWKEFRKGLFTSSNINKLMANKKGQPETELSDGAITYILQLIQNTEGQQKLEYYSPAMEWGNETEPLAAIRLCEELNLDIDSKEVIYTSEGGVVFFVGGDKCGGTPDMIFHDSIAEIKCPESDTHLYYKLFVNAENFQSECPAYYDQIQMNLFLCQKEFAHFFSFDPRFKKHSTQSHRIIIAADKQRQDKILRKIELAHEMKTTFLKSL